MTRHYYYCIECEDAVYDGLTTLKPHIVLPSHTPLMLCKNCQYKRALKQLNGGPRREVIKKQTKIIE